MNFVIGFKYTIFTDKGIFNLTYVNPINYIGIELIHLFEKDSNIEGARIYKIIKNCDIIHSVMEMIV